MIDEYLEKWLIKAHNDLKVAENEIELTPEKRKGRLENVDVHLGTQRCCED